VGLTFDALAEVTLARDLLRRWYGLELGLSEPDGGGYVRSSHATCETIRGAAAPACASAMKELAAGFVKSRQRGAVDKDCHAGLVLVAAPVFGDRGLTGVVYATGARRSAAVELEPRLVTLTGCTPEEAGALAKVVPVLGEGDLARIKDLVGEAAAAVERAQPAEIAPTTHTHQFNEIVGDAPAVRDVVKLLSKVVKSEATVLVHGESGTG